MKVGMFLLKSLHNQKVRQVESLLTISRSAGLENRERLTWSRRAEESQVCLKAISEFNVWHHHEAILASLVIQGSPGLESPLIPVKSTREPRSERKQQRDRPDRRQRTKAKIKRILQ